MKNPPLAYAVLALVYLAAAGVIYGLHPNLGLANPRYGLVHMVRGDAHQPFVRRALVPGLVRVTRALLPESICDQINEAARRRAGGGTLRTDYAREKHDMLGAMSSNWSIAAVGAFFIVFSLAGTLFVLRRLLVALYHPPHFVAGAFPLLLIVLLPAFFGHSNFIYDYPGLLLFATATLFIVTARWRAYLAVLALALLNKETAVLLPLVFAVTQFDSMPRRRFTTLLSVQGAMAVVIPGLLVWIFRNNPGDVVEFHLARNAAFLGDVVNYFTFEAPGPSLLAPKGLPVPIPVGLNLPFGLVVAGLVAAGWSGAPTVLKRSLPAILIPIVALQLFFGFVDEIRVGYEVLPVVISLAYGTAGRFAGETLEQDRAPAPG